MNAPSNANTSGLEVVAWRWTEQLWNGLSVWYHSTMKPRPKATERIFNLEPLVTAASAQAAIDAEKARADRLRADKLAIISLIEGACKLPPQSAVNTLREATRLARAALQQETQP